MSKMNENINLCEILKGHEGETFYCSLIGQDVKLEHVGKFVPDSCKHIVVITSTFEKFDFWDDGSYIRNIDGKDSVGEMQLFPSKKQRDWIKWDEENNHRVPKTWSELVKNKLVIHSHLQIAAIDGNLLDENLKKPSHIEKSALALLKIHQLIEVGYGGNVLCNKKGHWDGGIIGYTISIRPSSKTYLDGYEIIPIEYRNNVVSPIMFKTKEYAEEFIKYEENCSLLRIFNMVAYSRDIE